MSFTGRIKVSEAELSCHPVPCFPPSLAPSGATTAWPRAGLSSLSSLSSLMSLCPPQAVAAAAQAGLLQQQAELERKAAELEKKERELQSHAASIDREYCLLCQDCGKTPVGTLPGQCLASHSFQGGKAAQRGVLEASSGGSLPSRVL